jgi:hypothetical protein
MALEQRSKKELVEIIHQLQDKLKEMRGVEAQINTEVDTLKSPAVGAYKDKNGNYFMVNLVYDLDKNIAAIKSIDNLNTKDYAILVYKAKLYMGEVIQDINKKKEN